MRRDNSSSVDDVAGEVDQAQVVVAGVGAHVVEGGVGVGFVAGGQEAFGLFDDGAGVQGFFELGADGAVLVEGALLEQGDGGGVGQGAGQVRSVCSSGPGTRRKRLSTPMVSARSRMGVACTEV